MKPQSDREAIVALRNAQLKADHAVETRKSYRYWMLRYRAARKAKECRNLQSFLDILILRDKDSASTISVALCALKFYHEKVLGIEIPPNSLVIPRRSKHRNVPDCLTHSQVMSLLAHMQGVPRLQAALLYGTGSRITALLTLRLKDLDLERGAVTFRFDKGNKSRTVRLPQSLMPFLVEHIDVVKARWALDSAAGIIAPPFEESHLRKFGRRRFGDLCWYWLFPSDVVRGDSRWHATGHALADSLARAARKAGIMARVTPHGLRHAFATALVDRGENIRVVQVALGHEHLDTTEIYTHVTAQFGPASPLDAAPIRQSAPVILPFPPAGHRRSS